MIESGCSGFRRGNLPTDLKASGSVGGDPPPTVGVSVRVVSDLGSDGLLGYTGWVDSPNPNPNRSFIHIHTLTLMINDSSMGIIHESWHWAKPWRP